MRRSSTAPRLLRLAGCVLPATALAVTIACSVSESDERLLGESEAAYIDSTVPLIGDSVIADYVTALGRSMTSGTPRATLDWRFTVVNTSVVNAMALPGGFVYVTRGLIEQSGRLDELAGVMAHEIGHVVHRHSSSQMERAGKREVALLMVCTLTNACSSVGGAVALQVGEEAAAAQYSQRDETQADSAAVVITVNAGIDPEGLPAFLQAVIAQRTAQPTPLEAFFASHPTDQKRISALHRHIDALGASRARNLIQDTPQFHAVQDRLRALPPAPPLPEGDSAAAGGDRPAPPSAPHNPHMEE